MELKINRVYIELSLTIIFNCLVFMKANNFTNTAISTEPSLFISHWKKQTDHFNFQGIGKRTCQYWLPLAVVSCPCVFRLNFWPGFPSNVKEWVSPASGSETKNIVTIWPLEFSWTDKLVLLGRISCQVCRKISNSNPDCRMQPKNV